VSGSVLHPEQPTAAGKSHNIARNNVTGSNDSSKQHVVLDPKFQQHAKQEESPPTKTKSKISFLTSIGACAGVGASFLKEHNEESTFEYCVESDNGNNCYGSRNNDDKNEMHDLMLRFSNVGSSLSRTRTCTTTDTRTDESVMILNSRDNTVTVESIGVGNCSGNQHHPTAAATYDAFSTTRKLLFGDDKTTVTPTTAKIKNEASSFQYNNQSNILCNNNIPCVVNPNDDDDDDINNNINSSFLQWYSNPTSPHSGRSLMRSSFCPPKTLYSPAYAGGDDDDGGNTRNNFEEDTVLSPSSGGTSYKSQTAKNNTDAHNNGHHEIRYWRQRLHHASKHYGKSHSSTADAYFNLGRAQLDLSSSQHSQHHHPWETSTTQQKHQYDLAIENLTIAHGIWEHTHGPQHLAVGRALDSLALAIVRRANHDRTNSGSNTSNQSIDDLRYARRLLEQAFGVRAHHLGVWHVDTVETYNKLAGVLLHLGLLGEASRAYREVFLVRRAIFGNHHPSVAIAAHSLANCHYRRGGFEESLGWYKVALDVYEAMGLSYRHPAVIKLLRDQSRLEEFMELDP
jgi:tetratricopeptide (TPR) repeat protein